MLLAELPANYSFTHTDTQKGNANYFTSHVVVSNPDIVVRGYAVSDEQI